MKNKCYIYKKKSSETPFLAPWGLLFLWMTYDHKKNHNPCRGPSNDHSYQDKFELAQRFERRRLKCNLTDDTDRRQVMVIALHDRLGQASKK